jgi:hypothetical protein
LVIILLCSCNEHDPVENKTSDPKLTVEYVDGEFVLDWSGFINKNGEKFAIYFSEQPIVDLENPFKTYNPITSSAFISGNFTFGVDYHFLVTLANNPTERAEATFRIDPESVGFNQYLVKMEDDKPVFLKNGQPFFIEGVGGFEKLDKAAARGANAFRTWGVDDMEQTRRQLDDAQTNNMGMMLGIWLSQYLSDYQRESYTTQMRNQVQTVLDKFKTHPGLMIWCLGNEVVWDAESVVFLEELAAMIHEQDPYHPVGAVIHSEAALTMIAEYAPSIQIIGYNSYGGIYQVKNIIARSKFKGPYVISEFGPQGYWENGTTSWGAHIEPTSAEKSQQYHDRYVKCIQKGVDERCVGSFVFLWGPKYESTTTWFGMFVEENVPGLPINGEACPTVEVMEELWSGREPAERAPYVDGITLNGKTMRQITDPFSPEEIVDAHVTASDPKGYALTYYWEILRDLPNASRRPSRTGNVVTGYGNDQKITVPLAAGNYRLYVYVLNGRGTVGTSNIPFQVQ